jgi:hypothetical protein
MRPLVPEPPSRSPGRIPDPTSAVIWGPDRPANDRVALALARAAGDESFWFEIVDATGIPADQAALRQEIDPTHAFLVQPEEVALDEALGNIALWTVIREPPDSPEAARLANFLRIPATVRSIVEHRGRFEGNATIVVANVDRGVAHFSGNAGTFTPFIEELNRLGYSLVFTNGKTPRANMRDFAISLRIEADPGSMALRAICVQGDPRFAGPLVPGAVTPVEELLRWLDRPTV